ncbi:MAG: type II toxin-antitoxin system Phd/YefM family antitoxin [Elusimicrobia bacterium]|nr:type II toxin-antitoxin system Phd/YefM family antitoxin [Elusimicrobiota bacterium]
MTRHITLKELRPRLPQVMQAIDQKMDRFIVTRRGKPAAVIMGLDDYEGLLETLEILSDKPAVKRLKQAEADLRAGRSRSLDEVRRELDAL